MRRSSFGRLHHACAEWLEPSSVEELCATLARADREGRRVTLHGGAQTLDAQALNDDLLVSTRRLDDLRVDAARGLLHAGPGATWGAIHRALPAGLVPFTTVTTSAATAGGTLATDGHGRASPVFGRESRHVTRIALVTPDGRLLELARGGALEDVFHGTTGGLGYLGAIAGVTYELLDLRHLASDRRAPLRVRTLARRHRSLSSLLEDVLPSFVDGRPASAAEGAYGLYLGAGRGLAFRSQYVRDARKRPMPNHDLGNPLRVVLDLALRVRPMNALVWRAIHGLYYGEASSFVDDVFDYTFFMDGSRRASAVADRLGVELATAQQSFVLPFDFGERDRSIAALADLVGRARRAARRARLTTLMLDVMYVPGEVRDRVSLVPDDPGLVVTIALDASPPAQRARVERYLEDLTHEVALASGRVDLGKLVVARDEDLGTMHGRSLSRFLALKRRIDPRKTLRNAFFERLERIGLAFEGANGHAHNSSPSTS